jgi:hypothetical protein
MTRFLIAATAALLAGVSASYADTISGSYTAIDANPGPYAPTINADGQPYLGTPFSATLGVGTTSPITTFLQIAPVGGNASVGTQTGAVDIAMALADGGSAITGVTTSAGGNTAFVSNGKLYFSANYELFYSNQTDCLTWAGSSCTPTGNTSTIGETLTVSFADGAKAALNLYNWSDWNMAPDVSLSVLNGPSTTPTVPEPASIAVFGSALLGLCLTRRTQKVK